MNEKIYFEHLMLSDLRQILVIRQAVFTWNMKFEAVVAFCKNQKVISQVQIIQINIRMIHIVNGLFKLTMAI